MNVLAIDQGTSSTKARVVADGGHVLGESSAPVTARTAAGTEVQAVGIANQGETVLRWDRETGKPFGPALSWQDRRAATITRELERHGDRLTELTGLPLDPYFAAPKMT